MTPPRFGQLGPGRSTLNLKLSVDCVYEAVAATFRWVGSFHMARRSAASRCGSCKLQVQLVLTHHASATLKGPAAHTVTAAEQPSGSLWKKRHAQGKGDTHEAQKDLC